MKKHLLILGAVFWCFLISQAQDTQQPVVLVSVEGKIKYTSPGISKSKSVRAGAALKPGGSIQLAKGARVVLFCTDRFVSVSQPGNHSLKAVCEGGRAGNGLSFEFELGEYITAGVELAAYAKDKQFDWIKTITDPKTGGDGWAAGGPGSKGSGGSGWGTGGPGSKGSGGSGWGAGGPGSKGSGGSGWGTGGPGSKGSGGSGWGTPGSQIQLILPFGKVVNGPTTFFWSNQGKHREFLFTLLDEAGKKVLEAAAQDSFLVVNLNELNLQMGGKYHWQVQNIGGSPVASNKFDIEISSEEKRLRALKKLEDLQVFKDAPNDVALRLTAEAIALEKAEWFYSAYETYVKARKNHPNNLTRMMHTAFFARYGYYPLAEKAARKD